MTDEDQSPPHITLDGMVYVLAPQGRVRDGDEDVEYFMERNALFQVPDEMARTPSDTEGLFAFYW